MKLTLKPETVESLEDLTGKKIIRNGDEVVSQIIEMAKKSDGNGSKKSIEVCDFTESMANNEEETEAEN